MLFRSFDSAAPATDQLLASGPASGSTTGDGGRSSYIVDEDVRVVVVKIKDGRISDWKGGVKDWGIANSGSGSGATDEPTVNGVLEVA